MKIVDYLYAQWDMQSYAHVQLLVAQVPATLRKLLHSLVAGRQQTPRVVYYPVCSAVGETSCYAGQLLLANTVDFYWYKGL